MSSVIRAGHTQGKRKMEDEVIVILEDTTPQSKTKVPKLNVNKGTVKQKLEVRLPKSHMTATLAAETFIELEQKTTRDIVIETLFGTPGTISSTTLTLLKLPLLILK